MQRDEWIFECNYIRYSGNYPISIKVFLSTQGSQLPISVKQLYELLISLSIGTKIMHMPATLGYDVQKLWFSIYTGFQIVHRIISIETLH